MFNCNRLFLMLQGNEKNMVSNVVQDRFQEYGSTFFVCVTHLENVSYSDLKFLQPTAQKKLLRSTFVPP